VNEQYDELISRAAAQYDVPFLWIKAIIGTESSFNPNAYRAEPSIGDASRGLMQILEKTARGLGFAGPVEDLLNPAVNIDLGARLVRQLMDRFGDDFRDIYSAYNSGSPSRWLSSAEVAANVKRAEEWLGKIASGDYGEVAVTAGPALLLAGIAFYVIMKRGKK